MSMETIKSSENRLIENENEKTKFKALLHQIFVSLTLALGSLPVGFATAYSSPALASMSENSSSIRPNNHQKSWIASVLPLFAVLGGISGALFPTILGRKLPLMAVGFPFTLSFLLIALAKNISMVIVGRCILGICVGLSTFIFPIYLCETIEPQYRGVLGLLPTIFGTSGVLLSYTAGMFLDWKYLALLGATLPIPYILCTFVLPETPKSLVNQGKEKESIQSLQWLRGRKDVQKEFEEINCNINTQNMKKSKIIKELFHSNNIKPILICVFLMFFQQFSGINAIIFYSVEIFQMSGSELNSNISSIVLGVVNALSSTIATILIDKLGRKILLYASSILMFVTLALLGLYFRAKTHHSIFNIDIDIKLGIFIKETALENYNWIPLASLVIYIVGFAIGFASIPWLMMGELLPNRIKGIGASITTAFNWTCSFLITNFFLFMADKLGNDITFWLYSCFCLLSIIFIKKYVPETKGKSLEEIEKLFP